MVAARSDPDFHSEGLQQIAKGLLGAVRLSELADRLHLPFPWLILVDLCGPSWGRAEALPTRFLTFRASRQEMRFRTHKLQFLLNLTGDRAPGIYEDTSHLFSGMRLQAQGD